MPWRNTSSAMRKAACSGAFLSTISSSRSLGITINVSTCSFKALMPCSAAADRLWPSKPKGRVTTPMVNAPTSLAMRATTGLAPVPVPPPMPHVTNAMSAPFNTAYKSSDDSSAAFAPCSGLPPAPRPRVSLSPMRTRFGAPDNISACASVLMAMKSTPCRPSAIMRLTALVPPPPTPSTLI